MKNKMREDLLITREDILLHLCAEPADRYSEDEALAPRAANPAGVFSWFLKRLLPHED